MRAFLEHLGAIVGAFTVSVFAMSWFHEYGYFLIMGRQFQTFLTTADYLTNDVRWLPLALLFLYFYGEWSYLRDEQLQQRSNWSNTTNIIVAFIIISVTLGFFASISWPPDFWAFSTLLFLLFVAWSAVWRKLIPNIEMQEPFGYALRNAIRLAPPLLLAMFIYGLMNAYEDLTWNFDPYAFQFKGQQTKKLLFFLRNFDRGALVRDPLQNRITFYKWEEIESVSRGTPQISGPMWCWMFPRWCDRPPPMIP